MKALSIISLLISMNTFAGNFSDFYVTSIECTGAPKWIQLKIQATDVRGNYEGTGTENYLNFDLKCRKSSDGNKILCKSPQRISVEIGMDREEIVTAKFKGVYHPELKIGCIARM